MPPKNKGEGTKIAQAAKDLNVTSVTIRRYIAEFEIPTTADENGIKVLPAQAMDELHLIRQLKEDGMTNPKVLEELEAHRKKEAKGSKADKKAEAPKRASRAVAVEKVEEKVEVKEPVKKRATVSRTRRVKEEEPEVEEQEQAPAAAAEPVQIDQDGEDGDAGGKDGEGGEGEEGAEGDGRSKHSLTCQTCAKVFEHMNPRLRDCLECYRAKRKERRRGGDKHKNVIQHPLAQQVANKALQAKDSDALGGEEGLAAPTGRMPGRERGERGERGERPERGDRGERGERTERGERGDRGERGERTERGDRGERGERTDRTDREGIQVVRPQASVNVAPQGRHQVRNYRKAIEETRTITANLKRRLERPDLPESERRWLEQIYAYQLILHQGWRHLSEYKAGNTTSSAPREKE